MSEAYKQALREIGASDDKIEEHFHRCQKKYPVDLALLNQVLSPEDEREFIEMVKQFLYPQGPPP